MTNPPKNVQYIMMWKFAISKDFLKYGVASRKFLLGTEKDRELSSLILAANTVGVIDDVVIRAFETIKEARDFDVGIGEAFGPVVIEHKSAFIVEDILGNLPARNLDVPKEYHSKWKVYDYLEK